MVHITILRRIGQIEVPAPYGIPERTAIDEVVVGTVHLHDPHNDGQQHPQSEQSAVVVKERLLKKLSYFLHTACKGSYNISLIQIFVNTIFTPCCVLILSLTLQIVILGFTSH